MSYDPESTSRALEVIETLRDQHEMTAKARIALENAVLDDLETASKATLKPEERLQKVEGQVRALSEAVIAITAPSDEVEGAVQTVRDKMSDASLPPSPK